MALTPAQRLDLDCRLADLDRTIARAIADRRMLLATPGYQPNPSPYPHPDALTEAQVRARAKRIIAEVTTKLAQDNSS